ncbi:hypothetical protein SCLCIDRAFT_9343 [Scleroderma citrinum Foug A]|uniref:DUF8190 domain-containing protein n=1 Tax=Scleroderma citrinum Foug A TaxID=1036808 RepID=A0A0C3DZW2_9AGAM|nr:hypothetical protein SCLCIDRAFT_9343 [Scleroderma citrinum Foug A]
MINYELALAATLLENFWNALCLNVPLLVLKWEYENEMKDMALRCLSKCSKVTIDAEFLHTQDEEDLLWDTSTHHLDFSMKHQLWQAKQAYLGFSPEGHMLFIGQFNQEQVWLAMVLQSFTYKDLDEDAKHILDEESNMAKMGAKMSSLTLTICVKRQTYSHATHVNCMPVGEWDDIPINRLTTDPEHPIYDLPNSNARHVVDLTMLPMLDEEGCKHNIFDEDGYCIPQREAVIDELVNTAEMLLHLNYLNNLFTSDDGDPTQLYIYPMTLASSKTMSVMEGASSAHTCTAMLYDSFKKIYLYINHTPFGKDVVTSHSPSFFKGPHYDFQTRLLFQVSPKVVQWMTFGLCSLLNLIWVQHKENMKKPAPDPILHHWVELTAALECSTKILTRALMDPLWLGPSLIHNGLPTLSSIICYPGIHWGHFESHIQYSDWPVAWDQ